VDSLSQTFLELALTLQALGEDKVQALVSKHARSSYMPVQARTSPYNLVHARTGLYMPAHILHSCCDYY
jgi:hypothetical protein